MSDQSLSPSQEALKKKNAAADAPGEEVSAEPVPSSLNVEENEAGAPAEEPIVATTEVILPPPSEDIPPPTSTTEVVLPVESGIAIPPQSESEFVVPGLTPSSQQNFTASKSEEIPVLASTTSAKVSASEPAILATNLERPLSEKLIPQASTMIKSTATEKMVPESSQIDIGTSTSDYQFPPGVREVGTVTSDTDPHLPGLGTKRDASTSTSADKINMGTDTAEDDLTEPAKVLENPPPPDDVTPPESTDNVVPSPSEVQKPANEGEADAVTDPTNIAASQSPESTPSKPLETATSKELDSKANLLGGGNTKADEESNIGDVALGLPVQGSTIYDDQQWSLDHYPAYWPPELNYPGQPQNILVGNGGPPAASQIMFPPGQITPQVLFGPGPAPTAVGSTLSTSGWIGDTYGNNPQSVNPMPVLPVNPNQTLEMDNNYFYCGENNYLYGDDNSYYYCDDQLSASNGYPMVDFNTGNNANQEYAVQYTIQDVPIQQTFQPISADEKCTQTFRKATFTESAIAFIDTLTALDSVPCNTCDKPPSERDPCGGEEESSWTWMCSVLKEIYNDLATTTRRAPCSESAAIKEGWTTERASEIKLGAIATVTELKSGEIKVSSTESKSGEITVSSTESKSGDPPADSKTILVGNDELELGNMPPASDSSIAEEPAPPLPIEVESKTDEEMTAALLPEIQAESQGAESQEAESESKLSGKDDDQIPSLPPPDEIGDPENPPVVEEEIDWRS